MAIRRRRKFSPSIDPTRLGEYSHTELVQVAHSLGFPNASRQLSRETLMDIILGDAQEIEDPAQELREKIHPFVHGNASVLVSNMPCDLKCLVCPHHRVIECYSVNQDLIED